MAEIDIQYRKLALTILRDGFTYKDPSRGDIELLQIPSYTLEIPIFGESFPLLTSKRIYWKSALHELMWMLSGSKNIKYLQDNNVHIWDKDAENFDVVGLYVGRIYGAQWRDWTPGVDQIQNLIEGLKKEPFNRKHIVTAWNPAELNDMALPPCHWSFEIIIRPMPKSLGFILKWHQRSCDTFLGIPFDIASYAFLGKLIESLTGYIFIKLIGDLSNVHFYKPHIPLVEKQLTRTTYLSGPYVEVDKNCTLKTVKFEDFKVLHYKPASPIRGELFAKILNK